MCPAVVEPTQASMTTKGAISETEQRARQPYALSRTKAKKEGTRTGNPVGEEEADTVREREGADEDGAEDGDAVGKDARVGAAVLPVGRGCGRARDDDDYMRICMRGKGRKGMSERAGREGKGTHFRRRRQHSR